MGISLQETRFQEKLSVLEVLRLFRSFYRHGLEPADVAASVGFKAWLRADEKWQDNTVDVGVKAALTWYATDAFYLAPSAGLAWTNLAGGGFFTGAGLRWRRGASRKS